MNTTELRITVGGTEFVVTGVPCEGERRIVTRDDGVRAELLVADRLATLGIADADAARYVRKALGFRAADLAALLGVAAETISHWETGKHAVPRAAWATLGAMVRERLGLPGNTAERLRAAVEPPQRPARVELPHAA